MSDPNPHVLTTNERGELRQEGNATISDSHIDDAAEFRVRSRKSPQSGGGGKFAADIQLPDGKYRQIGALLFGEGVNGPEIKLIIHDGSEITTDKNELTVFQVVKGVLEFLLPIKGFTPAPPSEQHQPSFLQNGPYQLHLQGDRNVVLYDTRTDPWTPVWSSGTQVETT